MGKLERSIFLLKNDYLINITFSLVLVWLSVFVLSSRLPENLKVPVTVSLSALIAAAYYIVYSIDAGRSRVQYKKRLKRRTMLLQGVTSGILLVCIVASYLLLRHQIRLSGFVIIALPVLAVSTLLALYFSSLRIVLKTGIYLALFVAIKALEHNYGNRTVLPLALIATSLAFVGFDIIKEIRKNEQKYPV